MFPLDICLPCGEGPSAENVEEQRGEAKSYTEVGNQNQDRRREREREERGTQDSGKERVRI